MGDQELESIVQRMIDAGESEEAIASVIQSYPSAGVEQKSDVPLSAVLPTATLAAHTARPALNVIGSKIAGGALDSTVRTAGRLAGVIGGGTAGATLGGGMSLPGLSMGYAGAHIGSSVGARTAGKLNTPIRAAGKLVADATSTARPLPVRGAAGRMVAGALPFGRRMFNTVSKFLPSVGNMSILSTLLDQQGDGAGLPHPELIQRNMDNPNVPDDVKAEIQRILAERGM